MKIHFTGRYLLLVCLLAAFFAYGGEVQTAKIGIFKDMFRVSRDGKIGFIDGQGAVLIQPQYDLAGDPSEGLVSVLDPDSGLLGYVDQNGLQVIPPQFDEVRSFSEGLAAVRIGKLWGYIDHTGAYAILPQFNAASSVHGGLARIAQFQGFSCDDGSTINNDDADPDLFVFPDEKEPKRCAPIMQAGYVSAITGQMAVPAQFARAYDFSEGLGRVAVGDGSTIAYIDASGNQVTAAYPDGSDFSNGVAAVSTSDGWGFINKSGQFTSGARYRSLGSFSEGFASAESDNGSCGYIDLNGTWVIDPQYAVCSPFSNGYALVSYEVDLNPDVESASDATGMTYTFLDSTGKSAFNQTFTQAASFDHGLALVQTKGAKVYIDVNGNSVSSEVLVDHSTIKADSVRLVPGFFAPVARPSHVTTQ